MIRETYRMLVTPSYFVLQNGPACNIVKLVPTLAVKGARTQEMSGMMFVSVPLLREELRSGVWTGRGELYRGAI